MQWLQDPNKSNVDNLTSVRRETSRHFRNKKKKYLKAKIDELETNSYIKNIRDLYRDINDFKKGYQPRTNILKEEKGYLVTESYSILGRWRNHFSQLFHVHGFSNVRQTQTHRGEGG
jgi:flagellar basal body rod protein FlgC